MPKDKAIRHRRDYTLRKRYFELSQKHPEWRHGAIIAALAEELFISHRTASAIFNAEGIYGTN